MVFGPALEISDMFMFIVPVVINAIQKRCNEIVLIKTYGWWVQWEKTLQDIMHQNKKKGKFK